MLLGYITKPNLNFIHPQKSSQSKKCWQDLNMGPMFWNFFYIAILSVLFLQTYKHLEKLMKGG